MGMQTLGLASVIFLFASLVFMEIKWGPDYYKTFSRLVAQRKSSIIYYFMTFALFLTAFSIFILNWFVPQFGLPKLFSELFILGVAAQVICVAVPETGGTKTKLHLAAAGIMSACVLLQTILLLIMVRAPVIVFDVIIASIIIMFIVWAAYIFRLRFVKYELVLQASYFASYLLSIMLVAYYAKPV